MEKYEITAEMNLKKIIAESREVAQALNEFADNLEQIENKYEEPRKGELMTDTEIKIKSICEVAGVKEIEDVSDGFHTFKELYYQRMILFATIVKQNKDKAWKSLRHEDGELCFGGGWFIVGIDTPEGSYTYHYKDNFYSLFDCIELERGKHWDGHIEEDVIRLLSLEQEPNTGHWIDTGSGHNLCNSCTNIGCRFQSGIVRTKCAFYIPSHIEAESEDKE